MPLPSKGENSASPKKEFEPIKARYFSDEYEKYLEMPSIYSIFAVSENEVLQ
jgi:hypothetical protein